MVKTNRGAYIVKQKRKEQPYNARRYWMIFSVLAVLLLIPFRFTIFIGDYATVEGNLTVWAYRLVSLCIFLFGLKFIFTHRLRRNILLTMLIIACLCVSFYQTNNNTRGSDWHCINSQYFHTVTDAEEWDGVIFEPIWCSGHILGACCWMEYVKIRYIPITIKAEWFQNLSPNADITFNG